MSKLVEIRSYNLKPGSRDQFHRLVIDESLPMLKRWGVDVVAFGPSPHDGNSYYLIRAYDSLAHRQASQDAFYGSAEWQEGPRDRILPLIDAHTSIVLEMEAPAVDALRRSGKNDGRRIAVGRAHGGAEGTGARDAKAWSMGDARGAGLCRLVGAQSPSRSTVSRRRVCSCGRIASLLL